MAHDTKTNGTTHQISAAKAVEVTFVEVVALAVAAIKIREVMVPTLVHLTKEIPSIKAPSHLPHCGNI